MEEWIDVVEDSIEKDVDFDKSGTKAGSQELIEDAFAFKKNNIFGKLFEFVSKTLGYSVGIALAAMIGSIEAFLFVYFYLINLIPNVEQEMGNIMLSFYLACVIAFISHASAYGIWSRLGFLGIGKNVHTVNTMITEDKIKKDLTPDQLKELLRALTWIPVTHSFLSAFWILMVGLVMFTFLVLDMPDFFVDNLYVFINALISALLAHVLYTLFISELATGPKRAMCKKILSDQGIEYQDRPVLSVKLKFFVFIMAIIALSLYISNSLMFHNGWVDGLQQAANYVADKGEIQAGALIYEEWTEIQPNESAPFAQFVKQYGFTFFAIVSCVFLIYLVFISIFSSLRMLLNAVVNLQEGGTGALFSKTQDAEMLELTQGVSVASKTISDYRMSLEKKVEERTKELSEANKALQHQRKIMDRELKIAAEIQKGIIPQKIDEWNGLLFATRYKPMHTVSGDYYDVFQHSAGLLHVLIADVSGHGVPAALVTTMAKICFESAAHTHNSPKEIFSVVNNDLINTVKTDEYLTAFYIIINENHKFLYSNASHQKAKILRHSTKKIEYLDTNGFLIGAVPDAEDTFDVMENQLEPGDRLILYTDGLVEARDKSGEEFSHERMDDTIREGATLTLAEFSDHLYTTFMRYTAGAELKDDITFVIIEAKLEYKDFRVFLTEGEKHYRKKNYQSAVGVLEKASKINPKHNLTTLLLARSYLKLKEHKKLVDLIETALGFEPDNAEYHCILARSYFLNRMHDKASDYAKKALKMDPNLEEARLVLGYSLLKLGHLMDAQHYLKGIL